MQKEDIDPASGAIGFAIANFAISTSTLRILVQRGVITRDDALDAISRARAMVEAPGGPVDDPDATAIAKEGMRLIEQLFLADLAPAPLSSGH